MKQIFTLIAIALFANVYAQNKAGTLDSSFGVNGKTAFTYQEGSLSCYDAERQSDNKIICVGVGARVIGDGGISVSRFSNDGTVDNAFGEDGSTFIKSNYDYEIAYAAAIQPDDKIIVAGYGIKNRFDPENASYDILVARLNANGSVDSAFGINGMITADYGDREAAYDIAIQPDGKIIIQGAVSSDFIAFRYLPDGTPDKSFGNGGRVVTAFSGLVSGRAVVLQQDGKIIVAGSDETKALMVRYMPDGTKDNSFGTNGVVKSDPTPKIDFVAGAALQPDGKIILAGSTSQFLAKSSTLLCRYNTNGSLDSSFGTNGVVVNEIEYSSYATRINLQRDGKIITAGDASGGIADNSYFLVSRFNTDGSADSSFGTGGYTITEVLENGGGAANGLILQNDNKIVVAGNTALNGKNYIALARYHNDATPPTPITHIKRWLHKHGFTWEDCPPSICDKITGYAVQRSTNGVNWTTIFRNRTNANSQQLKANSYVDPSPLSGTNYYRLQTTSVSGAVANSNVIAVTSDALNVSLSPNPAKNTLSIAGLPANEKVKLTLVDFSGNVKMQAIANASSYNLNIASLHAGNYVIKMDIHDEVVSKQFVKE